MLFRALFRPASTAIRCTAVSIAVLGATLPTGAEDLSNTRLSRPEPEAAASCEAAALNRMRSHTVGTGENLSTIANRYGLTSATLMGFNPSIRSGSVTPGQSLKVPPYNGVQVNAAGRTWKDLSQQYQVRPDVLFEVNGCAARPTTAFIPGVNWKPGVETAVVNPSEPVEEQRLEGQSAIVASLSGYPLSEPSSLLVKYGWQLDPSINQVVFHGGIDIAAQVGDAVVAIEDGTVAYAATQGDYGNLVVVNHADGLQSRYAQLSEVNVTVGQKVARNERLGRVGQTGKPSNADPHLHFEMRSNSALGWVAQDPNPFLSEQVGLGELR